MEKSVLKGYLFHATKGISMYAHRARRFALTDRDVDLFVADVVYLVHSETPMDVNQACRWLAQVETIRNRSKTLYLWACDLFARAPDDLDGPATLDVPADPFRVIRQARAQIAERYQRDRDEICWEEVCTRELGGLATMAVHAEDIDLSHYDIYGFLHEILDCLASERNGRTLMMLRRRIRAERFRMANAMVAGDTLTDLRLADFGFGTAARGVSADRMGRQITGSISELLLCEAQHNRSSEITRSR